jgi:anaerobic selenocysteine-containing dehydrogenase
MPVIHHRTCHICEANCGILIEAEGHQILSIKGDPDNALSRGHICPKATALEDLQDDPDRLRIPQKRVGEAWQEISWEQAFAEIGEKARAILERDAAASAIYIGNPNAHSYGNVLTTGDLKRALNTRNVFSASTVDQMPHQVANLRLYGHSGLWSVADIDRTETMIILGGNPMASNGSVWTVPDFRNRAKALQKRGGRLIVIDPRRTETAKIADRHIFIRPATDGFLLVALLKLVLAIGNRAPGYALNLESVEKALGGFSVDACLARAGVDLADARLLAERLMAGPAALYGRLGAATQGFGTLNAWLIALINIAAGQFDREGGLLFPSPAVDTVEALPPGAIGKRQSRVSGHRDVLGEFPAACMAEEIEMPGEGQIRALFVIAGNPVLSTPNGARLDRALESLELMVSVDMYRNATSRRAHYILPPVGPLERDHYGLFLLPIAVRNFAKYSAPMFAAPAGAKQDWEILRGLAAAIAQRPSEGRSPRDTIDALLRAGPYGVTLAELEAQPSGMDFGLLQAGRMPDRLKTPDKTIDCAPHEFMGELERLRTTLAEPSDARLRLIGRRHLRSNNSWLHNSQRLVKGKDRCTLMIHPEDARARNLGDGSLAEVSSKSGSIRLSVEVTDDMMPGTISIPHGWGHGLPGVAMGVARAHAGVSINDLTDETVLDPLSGNAALSGIAVEVRAAG